VSSKGNIVVLISGSGSNLQAIMDAVADGSIPGRIAAVISNKVEAYGLERARNSGITTRVLDHRQYPDRESYDADLSQLIDEYEPELVILAGFMRILTEGFVNHYLGRMLNVHPSLLPKYRGLNTHARAIEAGDREHGVSIHFVTPELDGGPVILQASVPVHENDTPEDLASRVLEKEHVIYPMVTGWFLSGKLRLLDNRVFVDDVAIEQPLKLEDL
jgi:phosphoribosylglycinamide formyltransferase-1